MERRPALPSLLALLLATLSFVTARPGAAHEGHVHRGKPTEGIVRAVGDGHFTVETGGASVSVTVPPDVTVVRGERPVPSGDLRVGDRVSVFGTKLEGGVLVAHEIDIRTDGSAPGAAPGRGGGSR